MYPPTPYLQNPQHPAPQAGAPVLPVPRGSSDATADFQQTLDDPRRWLIKVAVPLFKPHQRVDPNTGKVIAVDVPKLYRIAENMQRMERGNGVPVRITLGHTEPGKPETEQPPIAGYYRNARVQAFGPNGEPAVVADEWLDPQYGQVRKNYPYRSAEYYDDTEQITGAALLTRDPFLDLGVVAYSRFDPTNSGLLSYTTAPKVPLQYRAAGAPTFYNLVIGERPMWPQTQPQAQAPAPPNPYGQPQYVGPPPQAGQPVVTYPTPYAAQQPQVMTGFMQPPVAPQYAYLAPPTPYTGTWPSSHQRHDIGHQHPSGGAVYGRMPYRGRGRPSPYADDMPPGGPEGPPPSDMGGSGDIIQQAAEGLVQIAQMLMQAAGGGGGGAPQGAFPPSGGGGGPGGGPPTMASRYQPRMRQPRRYGNDQQPTPYAGQAPAQPMRTISGLPVGYQMEIDRLKAQNNQLNQAMKVVFYERDQNDTEWCVSEIRRLAAEGYDVGEFEVHELKNKPREQRDMYLNHIAAHYSRVPTATGGLPPAMPGDPTPHHVPPTQPGRMTEDEMHAALRATSGNPDPHAFSKALHYMRNGGQLAAAPGANNAWDHGPPGAPAGGAFVNPYETNGQY